MSNPKNTYTSASYTSPVALAEHLEAIAAKLRAITDVEIAETWVAVSLQAVEHGADWPMRQMTVDLLATAIDAYPDHNRDSTLYWAKAYMGLDVYTALPKPAQPAPVETARPKRYRDEDGDVWQQTSRTMVAQVLRDGTLGRPRRRSDVERDHGPLDPIRDESDLAAGAEQLRTSQTGEQFVAGVGALMDGLRDAAEAEERAAEPEVVEHEEVGGYSGPGRQRGIQCSCGTWYEGDADEIREAFARHIERVPPQRLRDRDGDIWDVVAPGLLRAGTDNKEWTAFEVEQRFGPLTDPDRHGADWERAA